MYTLTATQGNQMFRFRGHLADLIQQAGEYNVSSIVDVDGYEVYRLEFQAVFKIQSI